MPGLARMSDTSAPSPVSALSAAAALVCVGQFLGPHGVHGRLRLRSFTADPEAVFTYGPLTDAQGQARWSLRMTGMGKDHYIVEAQEVKGRDAAEALKGTRLFVARSSLPTLSDDDDFYHADLIGLRVDCLNPVDDGQPNQPPQAYGQVIAVHDFGAGDVLEILRPSGQAEFLPFTKATVPMIDLAAGRLVVDLPVEVKAPELLSDPDPTA
jgi:16S rRNA processing protein RimM